jgi:hypothetical protein
MQAPRDILVQNQALHTKHEIAFRLVPVLTDTIRLELPSLVATTFERIKDM